MRMERTERHLNIDRTRNSRSQSCSESHLAQTALPINFCTRVGLTAMAAAATSMSLSVLSLSVSGD